MKLIKNTDISTAFDRLRELALNLMNELQENCEPEMADKVEEIFCIVATELMPQFIVADAQLSLAIAKAKQE